MLNVLFSELPTDKLYRQQSGTSSFGWGGAAAPPYAKSDGNVFLVHPDAKFEAGQIAKLAIYKEISVVENSDGPYPLGFYLRGSKELIHDEKSGLDLVPILFSRCRVQTDQYDSSHPYIINAPLYCANGKITSYANGNPIVGLASYLPTADNANLELLWF